MLNFEVVCPAGTYRRFASLDEARQWAEWGHACVSASRHSIFEFREGYGWSSHRPEGDPS